ncbi:MAG TPA: DUF3109 family protein [Paludibacteraceae bacterium]|nr:DUF3109 family protein [Paludibacteraceae bacterium]HRR58786.1 DUF3109 family protein [Paludibacteraceae bacterium]HRU72961.1 DUF3109 family protein [Paludibacteraceae bacterium]
MVEIGDTIVSFDLFEQQFCCDLDICKGQCCVEGDAGAPLEMDEIAKLEEVLPVIWNDLSEAARKVVDAQGVAYSDAEGDLVTSIVNRRECVFSYIDSAEGVCKCAIEKAYHEGKTSFYKPISCHLYPIRLKKFKDFTAVTYHRWSVCSCAETKGHKLQLPVYKFLKTPLIRRFGETWYKELEEAAKAYEAEFNK